MTPAPEPPLSEDIEQMTTASGGHDDLSLTGVMKDDGLDLLDLIKGKCANDKFFKHIVAKPKEYRNFVVKDDLVFLKLNGV
ncbi:hypothetical protein DXG01_013443, partial [Tephrocybe rancida]